MSFDIACLTAAVSVEKRRQCDAMYVTRIQYAEIEVNRAASWGSSKNGE